MKKMARDYGLFLCSIRTWEKCLNDMEPN